MLMWRSIIENMGNETNSSYKGKAFWGDLCSIWLLMLKRNGTYFPLMSVPYDIMSYPLIKNHTSPIWIKWNLISGFAFLHLGTFVMF